MFSDEEGGLQLTFEDDFSADYTLSSFLHTLQEAISEHRDEDSFLAQDLRSFVRLLDVLAQDYDVALMNPPYGSVNRMPDSVEDYVSENYDYAPEFYINFFEVCDRMAKDSGRIGMLVPWTFMFKRSSENSGRTSSAAEVDLTFSQNSVMESLTMRRLVLSEPLSPVEVRKPHSGVIHPTS